MKPSTKYFLKGWAYWTVAGFMAFYALDHLKPKTGKDILALLLFSTAMHFGGRSIEMMVHQDDVEET